MLTTGGAFLIIGLAVFCGLIGGVVGWNMRDTKAKIDKIQGK